MKYYFNKLRKINLNKYTVEEALKLFKLNYIRGRIIKKEYKHLIKSIYKNKKRRKINWLIQKKK